MRVMRMLEKAPFSLVQLSLEMMGSEAFSASLAALQHEMAYGVKSHTE